MPAGIVVVLLLSVLSPSVLCWDYTLHASIVLEALDEFSELHPKLGSLLAGHAASMISGTVYPDTEYIPTCNAFFGDRLHSQQFFTRYAEYVRQKCGLLHSHSSPSNCHQLLTHLYGVFSHAVTDADFHGEFLTQVLQNTPLAPEHDIAETLIDQYYIHFYGSPIESVQWDDPEKDLAAVFQSIIPGVTVDQAEAFSSRCNHALHIYSKTLVHPLSTVWNSLGCKGQSPTKEGKLSDPPLITMVQIVKKLRDPLSGQTTNVPETDGAVEDLLQRVAYKSMGDLVGSAAGFPLEDLRKMNEGVCPLEQIVAWAAGHIRVEKTGLLRSTAKVVAAWERLTRFLKGLDDTVPVVA